MTFSCVVADPPWAERGGGKIKRGADRHYPLMMSSDIAEYMKQKLSADGGLLAPVDSSGAYSLTQDAHMYLWVTNNFLQDGLGVIGALNFRYVTNVVWVKPSMGIGQYFRGAHELCLFAVRGRGFEVRTERRDIPGVLRDDYRRDASGRRVHSGKPEGFYKMVEARSRGPYLELFGRRPRDGWTVDHHGEPL